MHLDPHLAEAILRNSTVPQANTDLTASQRTFNWGLLISEPILHQQERLWKCVSDSRHFQFSLIIISHLRKQTNSIHTHTCNHIMANTVFLLLNWLCRIGCWEKSTSLVKEHLIINTLHLAATSDVTKCKVQQQKWQLGRTQLFWSTAWATATKPLTVYLPGEAHDMQAATYALLNTCYEMSGKFITEREHLQQTASSIM